MIKKQYHRRAVVPCYFNNFLQSLDAADITLDKLNDKLTPYDATIAKSKYNLENGYKINVKWNDPKLYAYFILRWS